VPPSTVFRVHPWGAHKEPNRTRKQYKHIARTGVAKLNPAGQTRLETMSSPGATTLMNYPVRHK